MSEHRSLPYEVVHLITTYIIDFVDLRQCALVNKQFYVALNPKVWRSPTIKDFDSMDDMRPVRLVLDCLLLARKDDSPGQHVRRLLLMGGDQVQDVLLLLAHTPLVEEILVHDTFGLTDDLLNQMIALCPRLKQLCLLYPDITDVSMKRVAAQCSHLRDLSIDYCQTITTDSLVLFTAFEKIDVRNCPGWMEPRGVSLLRSFTDLTVLWIHNDTYSDDFGRMLLKSDASGGPWRGLTDLVLTGRCLSIDDNVLVDFIVSHPRLKVLRLPDCQVGDSGLMAIGKYLNELYELSLVPRSGLSAKRVRQVIIDCALLNKVCVYGGLPEAWFPEISPRARVYGILEQGDIDQIRSSAWKIMDHDDILL